MNFKAFLLCLFILACGLFIYLKVQTMGDEQSYFNQHTRYVLGKQAWVRGLLALHNDGDARAQYLDKNGSIVVEVVKANSVYLSDKAVQQFADAVRKYTGRSVSIKNDDRIPDGVMNEEDLANVVSQKRRYGHFSDTSIFVIYTKDFIHSTDQIARTYQEFGMVLSDQQISSLVGSDQVAKDDYVASTMLHEFGHQLGLGHNDDPNCVMAASVEQPDRSRFYFSNVTPEEFCDAELGQLNVIKASLQ